MGHTGTGSGERRPAEYRRVNRKQRRAGPKRAKTSHRTAAVQKQAAGHEAAHALVAIRLGLPLASVDIRRRHKTIGRSGNADSMRNTGLVIGTVQSWVDQLPDYEARANLVANAAVAAAGVVVEINYGFPFGHYSQHDDIEAMVQMASVLGVGTSREEPAVHEFISDAMETASATLTDSDDTNRMWSHITGALYGAGYLSGDRVRELITDELEAEGG